MSWNVSPPEPAADMSKTSLPANTAIAQPALAGRWLLPVSLALLVISLAAMPLLDRISAYTLRAQRSPPLGKAQRPQR